MSTSLSNSFTTPPNYSPNSNSNMSPSKQTNVLSNSTAIVSNNVKIDLPSYINKLKNDSTVNINTQILDNILNIYRNKEESHNKALLELEDSAETAGYQLDSFKAFASEVNHNVHHVFRNRPAVLLKKDVNTNIIDYDDITEESLEQIKQQFDLLVFEVNKERKSYKAEILHDERDEIIMEKDNEIKRLSDINSSFLLNKTNDTQNKYEFDYLHINKTKDNKLIIEYNRIKEELEDVHNNYNQLAKQYTEEFNNRNKNDILSIQDNQTLNNNIDNLQTQLNDTIVKLQETEVKYQITQSKLMLLEDEHAKAQVKIKNYYNDINKCEENIQELRKKLIQYEDKKNGLKIVVSNNYDFDQNIQEIQNANNFNDTFKFNELKVQLDQVKEEQKAESMKYEAVIKQQSSSINILNDTNKTNEFIINSLNVKIREKDAEILILSNQNKDYNTKSNNKIINLESKIKNLEKDHNALLNKYNNVTTQAVDKSNVELNNLKKENTSLKNENNKLKNSINKNNEKHQNEVNRLTDTNQSQSLTIKNLTRDNKDLNKNIQELKFKNRNINMQIEDIKDRNMNLESVLKDYKMNNKNYQYNNNYVRLEKNYLGLMNNMQKLEDFNMNLVQSAHKKIVKENNCYVYINSQKRKRIVNHKYQYYCYSNIGLRMLLEQYNRKEIKHEFNILKKEKDTIQQKFNILYSYVKNIKYQYIISNKNRSIEDLYDKNLKMTNSDINDGLFEINRILEKLSITNNRDIIINLKKYIKNLKHALENKIEQKNAKIHDLNIQQQNTDMMKKEYNILQKEMKRIKRFSRDVLEILGQSLDCFKNINVELLKINNIDEIDIDTSIFNYKVMIEDMSVAEMRSFLSNNKDCYKSIVKILKENSKKYGRIKVNKSPTKIVFSDDEHDQSNDLLNPKFNALIKKLDDTQSKIENNTMFKPSVTHTRMLDIKSKVEQNYNDNTKSSLLSRKLDVSDSKTKMPSYNDYRSKKRMTNDMYVSQILKSEKENKSNGMEHSPLKANLFCEGQDDINYSDKKQVSGQIKRVREEVKANKFYWM